MLWDANKLEADGIAKKENIGEWGEFFFGLQDTQTKKERDLREQYIIDHNCPPPGQPGLWCPWTVTDDRLGLIWNRREKSYRGHEWLKYIVKKLLAPQGYYTSGIVNWFTEGEWYGNKYHTIVDGRSVRKYRGYSSKQREPDIKAWYEEELQEYDDYHQKWLKDLMKDKVEFLHEHTPMPRDKYNTEADSGKEKITSTLIKQVAQEELKMVQPMLNTLKSGDYSKLARYDDLMLPNIDDLIEQEQIVVDQKQVMDSLQEGIKRKDEQGKLIDDAVFRIGMLGFNNDIAIKAVQKVVSENNQIKDVSQVVKDAFLLLNNNEKNTDKVINNDLRTIIKKGKEQQITVYQTLLDAGVIKQDYPKRDVS